MAAPSLFAEKPAETVDPAHPPAIPADTLDFGSQRVYAAAFFGLIQAWKAYDLSRLSSDGTSAARLAFCLKYAFLDTAFVTILHRLRIPKLVFSRATSALLLVLLVTITGITGFDLPIIGYLISICGPLIGIHPAAPEISISGRPVTRGELPNAADHFKGQHIVHIRPEGSAFLNPFADAFCLPSGKSKSSDTIHIPIRFNVSIPTTISVTRRSLTDGSQTEFNITDLPRKISDLGSRDPFRGPQVTYSRIPINQPGLYSINAASTADGAPFKVIRSDVLVPPCPVGSVNSVDPQNNPRCAGGSADYTLSVFGVPPLAVRYAVTRPDGSVDESELTEVAPPDWAAAPLVSFQTGWGRAAHWNPRAPVAAGQPRTVQMNLSLPLPEPGSYRVAVTAVSDALGNSGGSSASSAEPLFEVHRAPTVRFPACAEGSAMKLSVDRSGRPVPRTLSVAYSGDRPAGYAVDVEFVSELSTSKPQIFTYNLTAHKSGIPVAEPGTYRLLGVRDGFCAGPPVEPTICRVSVAPRPSVAFSFDKIADKCAGDVGMTIAAAFVGTPPFTVWHRVYKDGILAADNLRKVVSGPRDVYDVRPPQAGNYTYEFYALADREYPEPEPITGPEYRFELALEVLSMAWFADERPVAACPGSTVSLPVAVQGRAPFWLRYEVLSGSSRETFVVPNVTSEGTEITVVPNSPGAELTVALLEVGDARGCETALKSSVNVQVRTAVPGAQIELPALRSSEQNAGKSGEVPELLGLEGESVELPVRFSGQPPWHLRYSFNPVGSDSGKDDSFVFEINSRRRTARISAEKAGVYRLLDVSDGYCTTNLSSEPPVRVGFVPVPSVQLAKDSECTADDSESSLVTLDPVCQGTEQFVELCLTGRPPFEVLYSQNPNGPLQRQTAAAMRTVLRLPADGEAGTHEWVVHGVADAVYCSEAYKRKLASATALTVVQTVQELPDAELTVPSGRVRVCVNQCRDVASLLSNPQTNAESVADKLGLPSLSYRITAGSGNEPIVLGFSILHELSGKTDYIELEVTQSSGVLPQLYAGLPYGKHIVTLERVADSSDCERPKGATAGGSASSVAIFVSDVPRLSRAGPPGPVCVGDHLQYQLSGVAPYKLEYKFNGVRQAAQVRGNLFSRLATVPGEFQIVALSDAGSSCSVNFEAEAEAGGPGDEAEAKLQELTAVVHEVPSVEVSVGESLIPEGGEAEVVFRFSGTPPFTLKYVRKDGGAGSVGGVGVGSELLGGAARKQGRSRRSHRNPETFEVHTVDGIEGYELRIKTNLQGTYEAVEVSDRWCTAKRDVA